MIHSTRTTQTLRQIMAVGRMESPMPRMVPAKISTGMNVAAKGTMTEMMYAPVSMTEVSVV